MPLLVLFLHVLFKTHSAAVSSIFRCLLKTHSAAVISVLNEFGVKTEIWKEMTIYKTYNIKHLKTIDYLIKFFIHSMTLFSVKRGISVIKRQSLSLRVPLCCCANRVLSLFSSCLQIPLHFLSHKSSLCRVERAYCSTAVPLKCISKGEKLKEKSGKMEKFIKFQ